MIKTPTTFVLGAGSSHEFGFPLGPDLVAGIVRQMKTEYVRRLLNLLKFSVDQQARFADDIWESRAESIDAFLARIGDRETTRLGKCTIAWILLRAEAPGKLERPQEKGWFDYLFNRMVDRAPTVEDFLKNDVRFVTFNYDRSLEHLFARALGAAYRLDSKPLWMRQR